MNILMKEMPDRAFDVGIAEGHAVTFSAGMAKDGLIPFCNIYSSFAQRAYDNIIHDVAISRLHVVLCLDRAGLVGEDGPTHHGAFDLAALRPIPNLTIAAPANEVELRGMMHAAAFDHDGPYVIRYPRGRTTAPMDWARPIEKIITGKGICLHKTASDTAILALGAVEHLIPATLHHAGTSVQPSIYRMRFLKPLDEQLMQEVAETYENIITIEDGARKGGLGSAVLEWLAEHGYKKNVRCIGIPDQFIEHGKPSELYHLCNMDALTSPIPHTL